MCLENIIIFMEIASIFLYVAEGKIMWQCENGKRVQV